MGTWNISQHNLNTDYAYYFIKDEENELEYYEIDEYTNTVWELFWDKLKDNEHYKECMIVSNTIKKYGIDIEFQIPIGVENGYYDSSFFKVKEILININDREEFDLEGLKWEIEQDYDSWSVFGTDDDISHSRAKQILKSIERLYKEVQYELNRILHHFSKVGVKGGWVRSETYFKDVYTKSYTYKHFNYLEEN